MSRRYIRLKMIELTYKKYFNHSFGQVLIFEELLSDFCLTSIGNVSPTVAPGPNVCFDVKTVTKSYGHELEWTIGGSSHPSCNNERKYDDNQEYTQTCCLPSQAEFAITCKDSYGDGWNGGYLEINGNQYCKSSGQWDEFTDTLPNPSPETPGMF